MFVYLYTYNIHRSCIQSYVKHTWLYGHIHYTRPCYVVILFTWPVITRFECLVFLHVLLLYVIKKTVCVPFLEKHVIYELKTTNAKKPVLYIIIIVNTKYVILPPEKKKIKVTYNGYRIPSWGAHRQIYSKQHHKCCVIRVLYPVIRFTRNFLRGVVVALLLYARCTREKDINTLYYFCMLHVHGTFPMYTQPGTLQQTKHHLQKIMLNTA